MELTLLYFGMVAEATGTKTELLSFDSPTNTSFLKSLLIEKYPLLHNIEFNFSLNQQLIKENTIIKKEIEIALLPPFAGG